MKSIHFFVGFVIVAASGMAQEIEFRYMTEFETPGDPLAIAADSNGGIYYTIFTFDGPNLTRCYYVADPVGAGQLDNHVLVDDADETDVPAGRGFTGIAVDGQGNLFIALESGNVSTATVRKLSPAPEFQPVEDFFTGIVYGNVRYNGVELLDDNTLALSTFNTVEFWDAVDATPLHTVANGEAFQRDLAFNPTTGDLYIAKNGSSLTNSVSLLTGGHVDQLDGYTEIQSGFIATGGVNSQFGINGQLIEYDTVNDLIIVPDYSSEQPVMALYRPSDPSAPVITIDGSDSPNGPLDGPADSVAVPTETGDTLLFITDNPSDRILVYTTGSPSDIDRWDLF